MRVVVTGATGNVGTALLRLLTTDPAVEGLVGIARRVPDWRLPKVTWRAADVAKDDLAGPFGGADAVVHLAWQIQPSRHPDQLWDVNAVGSARVFEAAANAGVSTLVHASSIGAYSPRSSVVERVDESWPTHGVASSSYSRAKAYAECLLDGVESRYPGMRVVRLRPALIFQSDAAERIRRVFLGALFSRALAGAGRLPVPTIQQVRFQVVAADDVAAAYRAALHRDISGPVNVAAEPALDLADVASAMQRPTVPVPLGAARAALAAAWRTRLVPIDPGWLELAVQAPLLSSARARTELGWTPSTNGHDAVRTLLVALRSQRGGPTPPLEASDGDQRWQELVARQGGDEPP